MNLMFSKKLELAMALSKLPLKNNYAQLKEINRIRNKVAHELFFDKYHNDLKKWASSVLGYKPKTINTKRTYKNHVIKAFSFISGEIIGASNAINAIKSSNRIAGGFSPPASTTPRMRIRTGRFPKMF